jgi:hypothetical protein
MIYRHDVAEDRFNEALQADNLELQAERIADLVIERELQKVKTRKAYRKQKERKKKPGGQYGV